MAYTIQEFASRLKTKHPEYAGLSDDDLVTRVIEKFPQYREQVDMGAGYVARERLASRGLTPEAVKGGQLRGEGEMRPATFGENVRSFASDAIAAAPAAIAGAVGLGADYTIDAATGGPLRRFLDPSQKPSMPIGGAINSARQVGADTLRGVMGVPDEAITDVAQASGQVAGDLAAPAVAKVGAKVAGAVAAPMGRAATRGAERTMNSLLKPTDAEMSFGAKPAEGAIGIVSASKRGMVDKIEKAIQSADNDLNRVLNHPANAKAQIDVMAIIQKPIDEAMDVARRTGDAHAQDRILALAQGQIDDAMQQTGGSMVVTPAQAHALKKRVNELINKWSEDASDTTTRGILQDLYSSYDRAIDKAVPASKGLNERMANTITAKRALERRMKADQKRELTLNPLQWIDNLVNTPLVKSGMAAGLKKIGS